MKLLTIATVFGLLFFSDIIFKAHAKESIPKFRREDIVKFKVPEFYKNVCNEQGIVVSYYYKGSTFVYKINPESKDSYICDYYFYFQEKELTLVSG